MRRPLPARRDGHVHGLRNREALNYKEYLKEF